MTSPPHSHRRHWYILGSILTIVLVILLALRLYLSVWVLDYVNNVLAHIDGYQGSVQSINIDLYRGAYRLNKLVLNKTEGKIPTPFLAIETTDLSVQWAALLHGRIVTSVTLVRPVLNFAVSKSDKQTGADVDWTQPIKKLAPVDINYVRLEDGKITYQDFSSSPKVDLYINHLHGEVQNLRNVEGTGDQLPSAVEIEGTSIGSGNLKIKGRVNILKEVPDSKLLLSLESVDLPALNSYTDAYAAFDFKSGTFNLYSQLNVKDSKVSGYIKPIVQHLQVNVLNKDNPIQVVWSSAVAAILSVFSNYTKDQFATKVDLDGNLGNVQTDTWSALVGIFQNAFVSAMKQGFDQTDTPKVAEPEK